MLRKVFYISFYSIKEFFLSKIFYFVFFLILFSFFISSIVSIMAVSQERKVLSDFFVALAQMAVLLFALIYPPFSINLELETKRIYLVLSKSVSRAEWFISKFISFVLACLILLVSVSLVGFIFMKIFKNCSPSLTYINELSFIFLKILPIISISISLSFITTSPYLAMIISTMIWIAAHYACEIKYSLSYIKSYYDYIAYIIYLLPDFSLKTVSLNFLTYVFFYSILWLSAGFFSFERKEL
ncbi:MAG: hypothetical protein ACP5PA_06625 [Elusimicrobiales bacterium]